MELTHASFFSGVGGLDLGLERAGWRTVSFSEIDPYACAVLAERWPAIPNLGDIVRLEGRQRLDEREGMVARHRAGGRNERSQDWRTATLWSGGFPCQDLSVAGKRRGLAGERSGLAFAFLDLMGQHRPRFILLENVPGLLSSHGGKDFGALLAALVELGYGVGYRILDARYFGVPQRRRRVFIVGDSTGGRAGAERAAEILSVGSRCDRHPAKGNKKGPSATAGADDGVVGTFTAGAHPGSYNGQDAYTGHLVAHALSAQHTTGRLDPNGEDFIISSPPDPGRPYPMNWYNGMDATDQATSAALMRRVWPSLGEEAVQRAAGGLRGLPAEEVLRSALHGPELRQAASEAGLDLDDGALALAKGRAEGAVRDVREAGAGRPSHRLERASQRPREPDPALSRLPSQGSSVRRLTPSECEKLMGWPVGHTIPGEWNGKRYDVTPRDLLPLGLDSHRYRCCGNGVVSDVAEWIGWRLRSAVEEAAA